MPAARNQEVTVRRPRAKRRPHSSRGKRAALRRSSQWASSRKTLASQAGKRDNGMVGSLTRDPVGKGYRVQGAGLWPPPRASHYAMPRHLLPLKLQGADASVLAESTGKQHSRKNEEGREKPS